MTDAFADLRAALLNSRADVLDLARTSYAARGRGGIVAVHADGLRQIVLYRAPKDLDAPPTPDGLEAVRQAVRTYDPDREAVVLVADSAHDVFSCWRVGGSAGAPEAALVWSA